MYHNLVFLPLYNGLVAIMAIPGIDVGVAVIIFTAIVRLVLFPLSKKSILTQARMKEAEPEVNKIKSQYANDRQVQALKVMEIYKEKKISPFSGILLLAIQLPVLLALISIFYKITPSIHPEYLYNFEFLNHFAALPAIKPSFLGLDLTKKSLILSLITGVIQFLQMHFSLASKQAKAAKVKGQTGTDLASNMANSMATQMKYVLPLLAFASTYWLIPARFPQAASLIAIYWSVSSLFTLLQELYISKRHLK